MYMAINTVTHLFYHSSTTRFDVADSEHCVTLLTTEDYPIHCGRSHSFDVWLLSVSICDYGTPPQLVNSSSKIPLRTSIDEFLRYFLSQSVITQSVSDLCSQSQHGTCIHVQKNHVTIIYKQKQYLLALVKERRKAIRKNTEETKRKENDRKKEYWA